MLDKAAQRDDRVGVEEGRKKAVRRLGMVLRHMQQAAAGPVEAAQRQTAGLSSSVGAGLLGATASVAAAGQREAQQRAHVRLCSLSLSLYCSLSVVRPRS